MCEVYSNAFLTLSATGAHSPDERLFKESDRGGLPPLAMRYHGGGQVYLQEKRHVRRNEIEEGAVSSRGWCLQERYLSQRILHFTGDFYQWECLSTTQHETRDMTFPYDSREPFIRPHGFEIESVIFSDNPSPSLTRHPYNVWYGVLKVYTDLQMTREEDRLPGVLGLALYFAHLNGLERDQDLLCGVWLSDLIPGLMWFNSPHHKWFEYYPSPEPTASWSWLNTVGPKEWNHWYYPKQIAVTEVPVQDRQAGNLTITLRGSLFTLTSRWQSDIYGKKCWEVGLDGDEGGKQDEKPSPFQDPTLDVPDIPEDPDFPDIPEDHEDAADSHKRGLFFLAFLKPIPPALDASTDSERGGWGLLLTGTDRANEYKRIGYALISCTQSNYPKTSCEKFWQEQKLSTVYLV